MNELEKVEDNAIESKNAPSPDDIRYYRDYVHPLLFQVSTMFMQGKTKEDILNILGLSPCRANQFELWFPDFRNAITTGFISTTIALENALIQAAKGFEYEEEECTDDYNVTSSGDKQLARQRKKTYKKYRPPDIKALELYLTNRAPEEWKKVSVDNVNTGTQIKNATVINISDDKIKDMISGLQKNCLQDTNPNYIEAETVDSESVFDEEKENG
jgi:hypothetical protein